MNVEAIREDFPILSEGMIYMDSAATSLTPGPVLSAVMAYYNEHNANVGRGVYRWSQVATQRYEVAHEKVAKFINAKQGEVVFTKNSTESINMIASGLGFKKGDLVITTSMEHHSNLLPWMRLKKYGVGLKFIKPDSKGQLDLVALEEMIDEETRLVAITHASNVLGSITPVNEISKICREYGSLLLVDGAQSVPHLPIDVKDMGCDFMAFSGHKMLGPTGTGILYIKESMMQEIEPLLFGGGMISEVSLEDFSLVESYERFEGGTPNIAGGIGLGKAIEYLDGLGMENVRDHEEMLTKRLLAGLFAIENVEVYGPSDTSERVGTVSFNIKGLNSHDVALILDESSEIMLRSGHHCCMPLIRELGVDGTVRASLYIYNTTEEVDKLLETLEDISRSLG